MNNITSSGVCENWNSPNNTNNINNNSNTNPSMVSYVGLQNNSYKQFWDWETNTHTPTTSTTTNLPHNQNVNPFMNTPTNFYDYTNLSSLPSSTFNDNFFPTSQFNDYSPAGFLKKEDDDFSGDGGNYYNNNGGRIGLNLGHRTYFSSRETALIDRLFRRPRGFYQANQVPRCQAEGCKIDLTNAKHYHRRHKVCEYHSKATKVVAGGLEQRFCQQCSRFHVLAEFDQAKRSCRKRLADHNRRRRKPQIGQTDSVSAAKTAENASTSRSEQHKEMSLSSSANLPLMISPINNNNNNNTSKGGASTTDNTPQSSSGTQFGNGGGPALSLGGDQDHHHHHQNQQVDERSFIFNQHSSSSSADMFHSRETTTVAPYHHNLFSPPHHVGSNQGQHPDDLQSLLHMRQNMFEVELL